MQYSTTIAVLLGLFAVAIALKKPPTECTSHGELLPNPDDCSTFYQCVSGVPHLLHCPPGLHYNPIKKWCDYPSEAKCQLVHKREVPECPQNPGNDVIHLPNPDDCSSFYKCNYNNKPVLVPCPPGLEFNPILLVCDWPFQAGCSVSKH